LTFKGNSLKIFLGGEMLIMLSCTFIGHKDCLDNVSDLLYAEIENLIIKENVRKFYVGTHGNFDRLVYNVLCKLELVYNIEKVVVLAYINQRKETVYYDIKKSLFPEVLERTPLRLAIYKRNCYMIDNSQFVICYINNTFSNTYTFVNLAINKKKRVINIGEYNLNELT